MPTERLSFPGAAGDTLAARLSMPVDGRPVAWALFAHCFTCSKDLRAAVEMSRALASERIAVLRFDFTGLGESEGDFSDTNFSSNVEDLRAAVRFMGEELEAPAILVGHSLGGAAVLHAAADAPSVRAVATVGAPSDPSHVLRHVEASREQIERAGEAWVRIGDRPFTVRAHFLEDLEATRMRSVVEGLQRPLLIFHSPVDRVVGIENAARLYEMARHPKSFVSLDDADHLLRNAADARYLGRVLAAWAGRYVEAPVEDPESPGVRERDRVVVRTEGGFRTDIQARGHALVADEPRSLGGTDAGPTPYDLVVAGLGACTTMTLRMYADRQGWPLEAVRVRLRHRKIHARDCEEDCEGEEERLDRVDREIELEGPLDGEQRARLLEIAERCPVHRTLDAGVTIHTRPSEPTVGGTAAGGPAGAGAP